MVMVNKKTFQEEYVVGVDAGTTSAKVIIFDLQGNIISEARSSYEVIRPHPGWSEQKAQWWWQAFCKATKQALRGIGKKAKKIKAIGITHQRVTIVPVDGNLQPLRNAILWDDMRMEKQVLQAQNKLEAKKIYQRTGYYPGTWSVYMTMWIRDQEPEIFQKIYKVLLVPDFLIYQLTGNLVTSAGSATMTGCLDIAHSNSWAADILSIFDLPAEIWVEKILPGGELAGYVHAPAAKETGLPENLPVITTAGDQPCGSLGAGVISAEQLGINGGTSCTIETYCPKLPLDPRCNYVIEISPLGGYVPEISIHSGGSALMNWFKDNFFFYEVNKNEQDIWESIYNLAEEALPGNLGLMLIPYFSGAHAPYWDLHARGVMFGFLLYHDKSHLVRAIMEGLAYECRRAKEMIEQGTGTPVREVRMYGGSARSSFWNQIFADILGVKVVTTKSVETTTLGAAICAAKGVDLFSTIQEAVSHMVQIDKQFFPIDENRLLYEKLYTQVYSQFYDRIQDLIRKSSLISLSHHLGR